jgi:hypothetical protein
MSIPILLRYLKQSATVLAAEDSLADEVRGHPDLPRRFGRANAKFLEFAGENFAEMDRGAGHGQCPFCACRDDSGSLPDNVVRHTMMYVKSKSVFPPHSTLNAPFRVAHIGSIRRNSGQNMGLVLPMYLRILNGNCYALRYIP